MYRKIRETIINHYGFRPRLISDSTMTLVNVLNSQSHGMSLPFMIGLDTAYVALRLLETFISHRYDLSE